MEYTDFETFYGSLSHLKKKGVIWFGISGSWRKTNSEIEKEVRSIVKNIMAHGDGIVSGGALSVDYFATDEALISNPQADRIRVFLPVTLELYASHYRRRAEEGVITKEQAEELIKQLADIRDANPNAIIGNDTNTIVDQETYFARNTDVANASDALVAFQVNESGGVEDTVKKAIERGRPVFIRKFVIE
ncbi:MAG: hypothetical protein HGA67_00140 [Candidatus Yonathbacteria bacterium]|nr:hypothetical protein [Candidatus Yonathbacteria bacterium]